MYPYDPVYSRFNNINLEVCYECLFVLFCFLASSLGISVIVLRSILIGIADSQALIHDSGIF